LKQWCNLAPESGGRPISSIYQRHNSYIIQGNNDG